MVRLFGHFSSLNLPSWTRHSYGHQLQHWHDHPGAASGAGPSSMEKTAVPSFFLSYSALLSHENYSSFAIFEFNNGHQEKITSFHKFHFA
jgi:hypothetical protein